MTRSGASTYDDDFYAWTQEQAAALRAFSPGAPIDTANLATEIEDLGKRDLREVTSFLTRFFEHLIKIHSNPASPDKRDWLSECGHFRDSAADAFTPSMQRLIDVEALWRRARDRAHRSLEAAGSAMSAPEACPFTLSNLVVEPFDLDAALTRLEQTRGSST